MVINDPIADMLTRIRNAFMINKETVLIPDSRARRDVLTVLKQKGYIGDFKISKEAPRYISVALDGKNVFKKIERISRPGCRVYIKKDKIPTVLQGLGTVILSTSKGVMSGSEAKRQGIGGEIICKIY
ncbi:MAG: 30S ribosomal protein S8 [Bacteriovoracaceae bacterium]